jgi:hypothetical protein
MSQTRLRAVRGVSRRHLESQADVAATFSGCAIGGGGIRELPMRIPIPSEGPTLLPTLQRARSPVRTSVLDHHPCQGPSDAATCTRHAVERRGDERVRQHAADGDDNIRQQAGERRRGERARPRPHRVAGGRVGGWASVNFEGTKPTRSKPTRRTHTHTRHRKKRI